MSETRPGANLVPVTETDRTIADPDLDVRGRDVVTSDGEKVGSVDDILIDDEELRVRFLRVSSGGFLGIGKDHFLVPVDVITGIEPERVRVDRDRARLSDVPAYDPELVREGDYYQNLYGWWGAPPYWGAGYTYPYPYY
ncbi:PRC-barrel domain-containing protein [Georgenia sp. EYE_87]|uniref:PRC-barrel domain-containing protein n=1 Tax=Georgenia sp. EYE_87 TaxID=2853448 RepID=UPI002003E905|nr:PRC-barrel domain-containing protein [Georgenia sp. EYE_87]MCK6210416.1 PRC-barrel domain-containing protein [Georgenia sp. EYE_87]